MTFNSQTNILRQRIAHCDDNFNNEVSIFIESIVKPLLLKTLLIHQPIILNTLRSHRLIDLIFIQMRKLQNDFIQC